jgi:hypothetical protein
LALDVTEYAAGLEVDETRWLVPAAAVSESLVQMLPAHGLRTMRFGDVPGICTGDRLNVVLLGHPLWRQEEIFWTPVQRTAAREARLHAAPAARVAFIDVFSHLRRPHKTFQALFAPPRND